MQLDRSIDNEKIERYEIVIDRNKQVDKQIDINCDRQIEMQMCKWKVIEKKGRLYN